MPTLLAVDDSDQLLAVRVAFFRQLGFEVIACSDPLEALCVLAKGRISIIVTDYDMPEMDGFAFSRCARARGFGGPIILSTGADNIPVSVRGVVDSIVEKSTGFQYLLKAVISSLTANDRAELSIQSEPPIREGAASTDGVRANTGQVASSSREVDAAPRDFCWECPARPWSSIQASCWNWISSPH